MVYSLADIGQLLFTAIYTYIYLDFIYIYLDLLIFYIYTSFSNLFVPILNIFIHIPSYFHYLPRPDPLVYPSIEILWRLKSEALLTFSNIVPQCGTFTTKVWY